MEFKLIDVNRLRKFKELLLNNTLTSENTNQALTAAQGKVLNDKINELIPNGCPFPLEAVYTQYPKQKSPLELWPETQWVELLEYNGAFFRSEKAPKTLYSVDGTTFYKDIEKKFPVEIAGLGNVTYTGTQYNSKGELMKIYTGSWTEGLSAAFIDKTGTLTAQTDQNKEHSHTLSNHTHHISGGGKHSHTVNDPGHTHTTDGASIISGLVMDVPGSGMGWAFTYAMSTEKTGITIGEADINIDTNTEGPNTNNTNSVGGNEARPTNYTIVIWKRIS